MSRKRGGDSIGRGRVDPGFGSHVNMFELGSRVQLRGSYIADFKEGDCGTVIRVGPGKIRIGFDDGREANFNMWEAKIIRNPIDDD